MTTTIREQVLATIERESKRRRAFGYGRDRPGYSIEKARSELWLTDEGKVLAELLRSDFADLVASDARYQIRKDKSVDLVEFNKMLDVLADPWPR